MKELHKNILLLGPDDDSNCKEVWHSPIVLREYNDGSVAAVKVRRWSNGVDASRRLDTLLELLEGCQWTDIAALNWYKQEDEKYATHSSLLAAIDAVIAEKSANDQAKLRPQPESATISTAPQEKPGESLASAPWLGNDESYVIFSETATPEQESQEALRLVETSLLIARSENPNLRLALSVSCGPVQNFFGDKIPARFVGRTQRRALSSQSLATNAQSQ